MPEQPLEMPAARPVADVAAALGVAPGRGLDEAEARRRRLRFGPNVLRARESAGAFAILGHQFRSVIVWLLAAAACFSLFLGDYPEAAAIVVVLLINGTIGFVTEMRAERSMEALLRLARVRARIRRGGRTRVVDARELVPGDIVLLEAGDIVPADLRIAEASNLQCDESVLTGESAPVAKDAAPSAPEAPVAERNGMAFKGTAVTQGAGEGLVVATGTKTELGRISDMAQRAGPKVSPLERRLDRLAYRLVWLTGALTALTVLAGVLRGRDMAEMVQTGIALAVAAVPEGLPVVATLSLARGMLKMAARNAVITRLSSVETLGATTVILTDKTGTLTENRMTAVRYLLAGRDIAVVRRQGGVAFTDDGSKEGRAREDDRLSWALRIGALCSNASLDGQGTGRGNGDPMEIALLVVARDAGLPRSALLEALHEQREHAFDPALKMMATIHADGDTFLFAVKGAPEAVLEASQRELGTGGARPLDAAARRDWAERARAAAGDGLRLLAIAMKHERDPDADPYAELTFVGIVGLLDPLRADVPDAIRACREAGVRVVMLTGDHAATAARIAADAGLGDAGLNVIEGGELDGFDPAAADADTRRRLLAADVFARVAPETKLALATLFQESGEVVAMTGDGVNDAPALKKADIGIAMGQRGTEVAREAADMVLRDDAFDTIVAAMRQGRAIFENIRKFVIYLMSCNVSEVLVVAIAVGAGLPAPLLPLQILFLNLVTDVFPAFALGLGRGDESLMRRPPRAPSEPIIDGRRWTLIGIFGALITASTLGAFALALFQLALPPAEAVGVAFLTLALAQLWHVFNMRAPGSGLLSNEVTRNPHVWGALAVCLGLVGAAFWEPRLSDVLALSPPGAEGLGLAVLLSLAPLIVGQMLVVLLPRGPGRHA